MPPASRTGTARATPSGPWESRDHLRAITPKRVILIARDKDRYGRTVEEVVTADADSENLNLAQVWSGSAVLYPQYCSDRHYFKNRSIDCVLPAETDKPR